MATYATLVIGKNGCATSNSSSQGVTSPEDRSRFLKRRRSVHSLLIGGNTARNEPYQKTPVPVVVISHSTENHLVNNPIAHWWNVDLAEAITQAQRLFGPDILIEAGPALITSAIKEGLVDQFELSMTDREGTGNYFNYEEALALATEVTREKVGSTTFITARYR